MCTLPATSKLLPSKVRFASASNWVVVEATVTNSFAVALLIVAPPAGTSSKAGGDPAPVDV